MTNLVERLRSVWGYFDQAAFENGVSCSEAADEIEALRQKLAESQAREAKFRECLDYEVNMLGFDAFCAKEALATPQDDTALKEMLLQAKHEALLEALKFAENAGSMEIIRNKLRYIRNKLRDMAKELKE